MGIWRSWFGGKNPPLDAEVTSAMAIFCLEKAAEDPQSEAASKLSEMLRWECVRDALDALSSETALLSVVGGVLRYSWK